MSRIAIYPYGPSDSVNILKAKFNEDLGTGVARRLVREHSRFRGRAGDLVINWGSSTVSEEDMNTIKGRGALLNPPTAIKNASLKTIALRIMQDAGVDTVETTSNRTDAEQWVRDGHGVFCRTRLQGHSGEGIVYCQDGNIEDAGSVAVADTVPDAPLYTKAIVGPRREFRIHVCKGEVIFTQLKKRRNNYRDDPEIDYSNVVRNYGSGWIYASAPDTSRANNAAYRNAVKAVRALGLDFGAVDVITNGENAWVLEVNTAPGQSGTTTNERYVEAFTAIYRQQPVRSYLPEGSSIEEPTVIPEPETDVSEAPWEGVPDSPFISSGRGTPSSIVGASTRVFNVERNRTRPDVVAATERSSRPAQPVPQPAVAPVAPTLSGVTITSSANLVDGGLYSLSMDGEPTFGVWSGATTDFAIIGFDMSVEFCDVTNVRVR